LFSILTSPANQQQLSDSAKRGCHFCAKLRYYLFYCDGVSHRPVDVERVSRDPVVLRRTWMEPWIKEPGSHALLILEYVQVTCGKYLTLFPVTEGLQVVLRADDQHPSEKPSSTSDAIDRACISLTRCNDVGVDSVLNRDERHALTEGSISTNILNSNSHKIDTSTGSKLSRMVSRGTSMELIRQAVRAHP
jgi:hypothetical protein